MNRHEVADLCRKAIASEDPEPILFDVWKAAGVRLRPDQLQDIDASLPDDELLDRCLELTFANLPVPERRWIKKTPRNPIQWTR